MIHLATPENGKINFANRQLFISDALQHEGHQIAITVKRHRNGRTTAQNAYYHVVVECLRVAMTEQGNDYTHDEVHEMLKSEFLSELVMVANKQGAYRRMVRVKSTTELDVIEFSDYLRKIKMWALDFWNIEIPEQDG